MVYTKTGKPWIYCELLKSSQLWFHKYQVWIILWPFEGWVWNLQSEYMGADVTQTLIGECVANASLSFHNGAKIQAQKGGTLKKSNWQCVRNPTSSRKAAVAEQAGQHDSSLLLVLLTGVCWNVSNDWIWMGSSGRDGLFLANISSALKLPCSNNGWLFIEHCLIHRQPLAILLI